MFAIKTTMKKTPISNRSVACKRASSPYRNFEVDYAGVIAP